MSNAELFVAVLSTFTARVTAALFWAVVFTGVLVVAASLMGKALRKRGTVTYVDHDPSDLFPEFIDWLDLQEYRRQQAQEREQEALAMAAQEDAESLDAVVDSGRYFGGVPS